MTQLVGEDSSSDSDYVVESYIKPTRVHKLVNDDSADLLGNFDDAKRKLVLDGTYEDPTCNPSEAEEESVVDATSDCEEGVSKKKYAKIEDDVGDSAGSSANSEDEDGVEAEPTGLNTNLTKEQLASLLRGTAKANRHVLYVTNLSFDTTKDDIIELFSRAGEVKSVRIPKNRRGAFAFVEMVDLDGFQRGFQLHNTELQGRNIKVQISEAGKKKSANKKNILKQKNRKLAQMRNEHKAFTKSGKFYDKTLKKEKAKELLARKRWRKKPSTGPNPA